MAAIEKTGAEMAADYARSVADGIEVLERVLGASDSDMAGVRMCEDCGYAGDCSIESVARCSECNDFTDGDADGETCDYCGDGVYVLDDHAYRPNDIDAVRLFEELSTDGEPVSVLDWLEDCLEIVPRGQFSNGEWIATSVAVLVAFGGPTCRVIAHDSRTSVEVVASWWSEEQTAWVYAPTLAAALMEYADDMTGGY